ncbi:MULTISPECIES: hypothetical protein [unclassified Pseudomonas]|uniref:hypothetical protein n=1 Tax=unclassified Pseudomonas TaxID=196821 RepID=UPI0015A15DBC|nr:MULTISPECIES: hypothetical protein [unclassified Pseudomonas]MEE5127960.1 hypothetical protein [Pseudomonas alliivorans]NWC94124.1 hypothetical protein [Pseudomonas sp. IPO3779]NWD16280.1 hypothetical protein [Pseudomonas sp. IPO3778]
MNDQKVRTTTKLVNGVLVVTTEVVTDMGIISTSEGLVQAMEAPYKGLSPEQRSIAIHADFERSLVENHELVAQFVN